MKYSAIIATCALAALTALATAPAVSATPVDDSGTAWIYGDHYRQDAPYCLSSGAKRNPPILQVKNDQGRWVTISRGKLRASSKCSNDPGYGYRAWFSFTLDELGNNVGGDEYIIQAQIVFNGGTKVPFTKYVYPNAAAHANALAGILTDLLTGN